MDRKADPSATMRRLRAHCILLRPNARALAAIQLTSDVSGHDDRCYFGGVDYDGCARGSLDRPEPNGDCIGTIEPPSLSANQSKFPAFFEI